MSTTAASFDVRLTVCICTRNRPDDLVTAISSAQASRVPVEQIVVSDDSTDDRSRALIADRFPDVTYVDGPRRGLCANRNAALRAVRGTHVIFIDDDAALGTSFLEAITRQLAAAPVALQERTIVTGLERLRGRLVYPSDQTFLGYQRSEYRPGQRINTVVINAAVFPTHLFDRIGFDTNLVYGSDEVDLTTRAVAAGYSIALCADAVNDHYSSDVNRNTYSAHLNASRMYVTLKRYLFTERSAPKAVLYALVAPVHLALSETRRHGLGAVKTTASSVVRAAGYFLRYLRTRSDRAARMPATMLDAPMK